MTGAPVTVETSRAAGAAEASPPPASAASSGARIGSMAGLWKA